MIRADGHNLESTLKILTGALHERDAEEIFSRADPQPGAIITVKEKPWGTIGHLVIDTLVSGKCSGGIRMAPGISEDEVVHLARAMTLKFAFKNTAIGGAKSCIITPPDAGKREIQDIQKAFGCQLSPVLKSLYHAGGDMGVGPEEVKTIKRAAGLEIRDRPADKKAGFFTALGVFLSARSVVQKLGIRAEDCRLAIEGYGNVGRSLVKLFFQSGFKIIALSTIQGALLNPKGLDVNELERLAEEHGDHVIGQYKDADKISKSALISTDADIIIPGARPWAIRKDNVDYMRARAVVTAANIPVTRDAARILKQNGIVYIPDIVSTGGGIMGCSLTNQGFGEKDVIHIMDKTFAAKIARLMELAELKNASVEDVAIWIAKNNFLRLRKNQSLKKRRVSYFFLRLREEKSLIPLFHRAAEHGYKKTGGKFSILRKMLKPLAVSSAYGNTIGDMKYYPRIR